MERMKRIGVGLRPRIISKIDNIMKSQFDACGEHNHNLMHAVSMYFKREVNLFEVLYIT